MKTNQIKPVWCCIFTFGKKKMSAWTLHSELSTVTAPAAAWLITRMQGIGWQVRCPEEYLLLTLAHTKIGWWIDGKTQGCRWHILLKKRGKCLSNQITPSAHSHTGLFRLVMDAITIHTCSSHLHLYITGETASLFPFLCRPQKGLSALCELKEDVWLRKWFKDYWPKFLKRQVCVVIAVVLIQHSRELTNTEVFIFFGNIKEI